MNSKVLALVGALLVAAAVWFLTNAGQREGAIQQTQPVAVDQAPQAPVSADLAAPEELQQSERTQPVRVTADVPITKPSTSAKDAPLTLVGRLVDERGAAVAEAKVMVATVGAGPEFALDELGDMANMGAWMALETVQTGSDGRFEVPFSRKSNSVQVAARYAGKAPLDKRFDVTPGKNDLGDIVVTAGAVLVGRVVDSRGSGVAGVEVHRKRAGNDMMANFNPFAGPVVATSDATGRFQVDQLALGEWKLSFTHAEYPDATAEGSTSQGNERVANLEVRLADGYAITGIVTGLEGKWTDDLHVAAMKAGGGAFGMPDMSGGRRAKVAQDGAFRLAGLSNESTYRLRVVRGDKQDMMQMMGARRGGTEAKGGDRGVRVPFQDETAIVAQVVDARTKAPIVAFRVEAGAQWKVPLTDEKGKPQSSFPEGRFRFTNIVRMNKDAKMGVKIVADGYRTYEKGGIELADGATVDLGMVELEPAPMARITVVDATTKKPVANAKVTLEAVKENGREGNFAFAVGADDEESLPMMPSGDARTAKSGTDGVALVSMEPGKRLRAVVKAKNYAEWTGAEFLAPAEGEQALTAELIEGGTVAVTVLDATGQPVAKQAVELGREGEDWAAMMGGGSPRTNAKGKVEFKNLLPGAQKFRIAEDGLFGGGGRVRMRAARSTGDGMVDLEPQEDAQWTIVQVEDKGRHEVTLTVAARSTVTGIVREGGKPVSGATVRVDADEEGVMFAGMGGGVFGGDSGVKTDASGAFTLTNVEAGSSKLVVTAPNRAMPHTQDIEILAGETKVDVALSSASVEGVVVDEKGLPVAGAKVRALRAPTEGQPESRGLAVAVTLDAGGEGGGEVMEFGGGQATTVTTDSEGRYKLRGLPSGTRLLVEVRAKEARPKQSDPFELAMDEAKTGWDLMVQPGASLEIQLRRTDGKSGMFFARGVRLDDKDEETSDTAQQFSQTLKTRLTGMVPGKWKITVTMVGMGDEADGGVSNSELPPKVLEVRSGQKNEVIFDL
jgi:protocatechuate 3,4-dioxygenase beta subunit